jgi:hypothetical protein
MQDQRIEDARAGRLSEEQIDNAVLDYMLIGASWPWSMQEIVREFGDRVDAEDAVARLLKMGLVHRVGEFVFPTRTARRAAELQVGTA